MLFNILIVIGVAVLSLALRAISLPIFHRIGTIGIFITSFLLGWLICGSVWIGIFFASLWLFLPWLEILTRIRHLRLPLERRLQAMPPPTRNTFQSFEEITSDVEAEEFEYIEDAGWKHEGYRHFFRIFYSKKHRSHAAICLVEQDDMAFFYIFLTSIDKHNRRLTTWNYPFSYGLKLSPKISFNRYPFDGPFGNILDSHLLFLLNHGYDPEDMQEQDQEKLKESIEYEMDTHISHNIERGLLIREDKKFIRYTVRGWFFLWFEFLRDLVRLS
ncbi:MAG: hypothetical protein ACK5LK_10060 [Chthoniobacterales bacterium]